MIEFHFQYSFFLQNQSKSTEEKNVKNTEDLLRKDLQYQLSLDAMVEHKIYVEDEKLNN